MTSKSADKERRRAPRAVSRLTLDLYDPRGKAVLAEGRFVNLSPNGALLESPKPFKVKDRIKLRYQPGKVPVIDVNGRIVWASAYRRSFRYGVKFSS